MVRKSRKGSKSRRRQRGGEFNGGRPAGTGGDGHETTVMKGGGSPAPWSAGAYNVDGSPMAASQYYTISAGGGRRRRHRSRRSRKNKKGGDGVLATAAVPFGLLALQRYFKGSKSSKKGVAKMGRTFKRTFRRQRGGSALGGKVSALGASTY